MTRVFLLSVLFFVASVTAYGQDAITIKRDSSGKASARVDTLKSNYVNVGKIQARRAAIRSAMVPGLGQIGNGITVYRLIKVAGIYTGATLLTLSYIQNNKNYHIFLKELQYRQENKGVSPPGSIYAGLQTSGLTLAKETYRRNREVVIFSFIALYGVNIVEAYIDARLKYFDIGEDLALKITPGTVSSGSMYGYNSFAPALKISLRLGK